MKLVYEFIILYVIMFFIDYLILKKLNVLDEYNFMKNLCHLKRKKKPKKSIKIISSLINSFILSLVCVFAININLSLIIVIPLTFILLMLLIYSLYKIYGNILKNKESKNSRK